LYCICNLDYDEFLVSQLKLNDDMNSKACLGVHSCILYICMDVYVDEHQCYPNCILLNREFFWLHWLSYCGGALVSVCLSCGW